MVSSKKDKQVRRNARPYKSSENYIGHPYEEISETHQEFHKLGEYVYRWHCKVCSKKNKYKIRRNERVYELRRTYPKSEFTFFCEECEKTYVVFCVRHFRHKDHEIKKGLF